MALEVHSVGRVGWGILEMNTREFVAMNKRWLAGAIVGLFCAVGCIVDATASENTQPLVGAWTTHYQTTFLTVSVEDGGGALVYWNWDGSHSVYRTRWKEMPNGVLIEGLPRLRIWCAEDSTRPIMQMEPLDPKLEVSDEMRRFPLELSLSKVAEESREEWAGRSLPKGWDDASPPKTEATRVE